MYSYEQRRKAVDLYIQYDFSAASVINELGYPNYKSLIAWYKQYKETGELVKEGEPYRKYTAEQRSVAVKHYLEHGKCVLRTVRILGYPSRPLLTQWIKEDVPKETRPCTKGQSLVHLSKEQKEQAVLELCTREGSAQEIADKYNVSKNSVYNWAWDLLGKGNISPMPKKPHTAAPEKSEDVASLKKEIEQLHTEAEELQHLIYRLRLEKEVLEKAAEVIKKMRASVSRS